MTVFIFSVKSCITQYKKIVVPIKFAIIKWKFVQPKTISTKYEKSYNSMTSQTIPIIPIKYFDIVFAEHIASVRITNLFVELAANFQRLLGAQPLFFKCFWSKMLFSTVCIRLPCCSNYVQLRCWSDVYKLFEQIQVIKCINFNSIHMLSIQQAKIVLSVVVVVVVVF